MIIDSLQQLCTTFDIFKSMMIFLCRRSFLIETQSSPTHVFENAIFFWMLRRNFIVSPNWESAENSASMDVFDRHHSMRNSIISNLDRLRIYEKIAFWTDLKTYLNFVQLFSFNEFFYLWFIFYRFTIWIKIIKLLSPWVMFMSHQSWIISEVISHREI